MRIDFDDGSFIELTPVERKKENGKIKENMLSFTLCGFKDYNTVTMSYSDLNVNQVDELIRFLAHWSNAQKK